MDNLNTITKGDLIEMLEQYDDEQLIAVSVKSGDYWYTQLAIGINDVTTETVEYTGYHNQYKISESDEDIENNHENVIILTLNY